MNNYLDIPLEITRYPFLSLFEDEQRFETSLNIIGEVMNVPMCALESILRANGYDEVEPGSICIDEKMLSVFADAYIRKMKNYFLSSVRNIENLSYEEFTDLDEFYNIFKKQDVKKYRINKPILEFKTVARESVHAPHSKFKMIFYFLLDDEYPEV